MNNRPLSLPNNHPPAYTPDRTQHQTNRPDHRQTFDQALDRASDKDQVSDKDRSLSLSVSQLLRDDEEIGEATPGGEVMPADRSLSQQNSLQIAAKYDDSELEGNALEGTVISGESVLAAGGVAGEQPTQGSVASVPASVISGPLLPENIAALMLRMERMPDSVNGQWKFSVLNDPAGISSLQLQRTMQGGWRISLSMKDTALVDEERLGNELKASLVESGHKVDSILVSKISTRPGND